MNNVHNCDSYITLSQSPASAVVKQTGHISETEGRKADARQQPA
jgi:hypothetical protein